MEVLGLRGSARARAILLYAPEENGHSNMSSSAVVSTSETTRAIPDQKSSNHLLFMIYIPSVPTFLHR